MNKIAKLFILISLAISCAKKPSDDSDSSAGSSSSRFLYVATGTCYSGAGNTTFTATTASNLVYRLNLSTAAKDATIADYYGGGSNAGDSPVGLASYSSSQIYIMVENATAGLRRVEKTSKSYNSSRYLFTSQTGAGALTGVARSLAIFPGGDLLVARTTGIPYLTSDGNFMPSTTTAFSIPNSAPCASSNTGLMKAILLSSSYGRSLFVHAAASQNRFGILPSTGGNVCMTGGVQAAPTANAYPTSATYDPVNSLVFVSYAGNSSVLADINSIYVYPITETSTTVSIGTGQKIYDVSQFNAPYTFLLYGISEITYDSTTKSLFVASAISTATTITNYKIERFTIDHSQIGVDNTKVLNRSSNIPFYNYGSDTKCVSQMIVSD